METYVLPRLGDLPVDQVGTAAIDDVLRPLALAGKHPTARAVGTHIAAVLRYAALREFRPNDNPVSVVLANLPKRTRAIRHHAALHFSEVGAALRRIDSGTSFAKLAVRLTVLTAARQAEIRRATPDQFDLEAAVWTVPAASMKMSREHRVPLSRQALAVARAALERNGSAYLFPRSATAANSGPRRSTRRCGARTSMPHRTGSGPASRTGRATTGWSTRFPSCALRMSKARRRCRLTRATIFWRSAGRSCSSGRTIWTRGLSCGSVPAPHRAFPSSSTAVFLPSLVGPLCGIHLPLSLLRNLLENLVA